MQLLSVRFDFHSCNTEGRSVVRCCQIDWGHRVCTNTHTHTPTHTHIYIYIYIYNNRHGFASQKTWIFDFLLIFVFANLSLMWLNFKSRHFKYRVTKVTDACAMGNHKTTEPCTSLQVIHYIGNTAYVRTSIWRIWIAERWNKETGISVSTQRQQNFIRNSANYGKTHTAFWVAERGATRHFEL